ncbi:MAG: hypothetical protein WCL00_10335 [Bacteroidota bacterium]
MRKRLLLAAFLMFALLTTSWAQDSKEDDSSGKEENTKGTSLSFGADLVSRFVWRGTDLGNSPAIQPSITFSWKGFSLGAWGTYAFTSHSVAINDSTRIDAGKYEEFDLYLSYTWKWFTLMIYDYYSSNGIDPNGGGNYFDFKNSTTGHTLEGSLLFDGPKKFPVKLMVATFLYGDDKGKDSSGVYGMGTKNNYSTYLELGYQFHLQKVDMDLSPFLGASLLGSGCYGSKAGVINLGVTAKKVVPITPKFELPLQLQLITNPVVKSVFLVFIVTL